MNWWWLTIAFFIFVTIFGAPVVGIILGGPFLVFYLIERRRETRRLRELQEDEDENPCVEE